MHVDTVEMLRNLAPAFRRSIVCGCFLSELEHAAHDFVKTRWPANVRIEEGVVQWSRYLECMMSYALATSVWRAIGRQSELVTLRAGGAARKNRFHAPGEPFALPIDPLLQGELASFSPELAVDFEDISPQVPHEFRHAEERVVFPLARLPQEFVAVARFFTDEGLKPIVRRNCELTKAPLVELVVSVDRLRVRAEAWKRDICLSPASPRSIETLRLGREQEERLSVPETAA